MFTPEQNAKFNDARAVLTQGIDAIKSGETLVADAQTQLQALQAEVGVKEPVSTEPDQNGMLTVEQAQQMVADAVKARDAADTTTVTQEAYDLALAELAAAKEEIAQVKSDDESDKAKIASGQARIDAALAALSAPAPSEEPAV